MKTEEVILVDERDEPVGTMEKIEARTKAILHRAFSIFIFNSKGEMLLQQRALSKYHSGGLWTNACCSHPRPGEGLMEAAKRRLKEEMGIDASLVKVFDFIYRAELDNGLIEHEFDHVFAGEYNGEVFLNSHEVETSCYKSMGEIQRLLLTEPGQFTAWFQIAFPRIHTWWKSKYEIV